jgi:hypothetical protein
MTFDYSLSSMLPFARVALVHLTSNFTTGEFTDKLFDELKKAEVR